MLHYIDNEVPWEGGSYGEWTARTQEGGSTIQRLAAAAWPDRGSYGLRAAIVGDGNETFLTKGLVYVLDPGSWIWYGFWLKVPAFPSAWTVIWAHKTSTSSSDGRLLFYDNGKLTLYVMRDDGSSATTGATFALPAGAWTYVVVAIKRATGPAANDGEGKVYMDGVLASTPASGIDNYDRYASIAECYLGVVQQARNGFSADFDEFKIDTAAYPPPYAPAPSDELPSPARMVVLYRGGSADSRTFAEYCATSRGIPRANLIRLQNAAAGETLADYAAFQSQIENAVAAYFAFNPVVASNCTCFLVGYGVPGYFNQGGAKYSATSRLSNYGTVFTPEGIANPLYDPPVIQRLSKTALGGKYLACRIDAASLSEAQGLLDRAGTSARSVAVADKLFSDDAAYRASLPCQKLRIITAAMGSFTDDALVFGDTASPFFGTPAGGRISFVNDSSASCDLLRSGAAACRQALFSAGATLYASALGCSGPAETFDEESFFEMLRVGGTLAEACLVATAKLDLGAVACGWGLLAVAFQKGGHNIYQGVGGIEQVEYETPAACLRPGQQAVTLTQVLLAGQRHVYAARAVSPTGLEDGNTHVFVWVEADDSGDLLPPPLARPTDLTLKVLEDGRLLLGFSDPAPAGFGAADSFEILTDYGTGRLDLENPLDVIDRGEDEEDFEVVLSAASSPLLLAVRPKASSQTGPMSQIVSFRPAAPPLPARLL